MEVRFMARLIIVAGASGAGKTFMLLQLSGYRDDIIAIKKYTTRSARKGEPKEESIDLKFNCKPNVNIHILIVGIIMELKKVKLIQY